MREQTKRELKQIQDDLMRASRWERKMSGVRDVERLLGRLSMVFCDEYEGLSPINTKSNFAGQEYDFWK